MKIQRAGGSKLSDEPINQADSAAQPAASAPLDDIQAVERLRSAYATIRNELGRVIVGQEQVIDQLLICLFAQGHVMLEGVPGLAKTLMIRSLAACLGLKFNRIQFTPDLMPSDITGTEVIQEDRRTGQRSFRFLHGPIFCNVLLADEVNRTPPKTQAALLEAMSEVQVTIGGVNYPIDPPFFVLATQNPIEQEGTYPLPEAQQDRFMFKVFVDYPTYDDEYQIAERTTSGRLPALRPVLGRDEIVQLQDVVRRVPAAPSVIHYALELVRRTRPSRTETHPDAFGERSSGNGNPRAAKSPQRKTLDMIERMVTFGAGPRAVQYLLLGAKARAVMLGRKYVATEDVRALAHPVLRHRIICNYTAEAEGIDADKLIDHVIESLPTHDIDGTAHAGLAEVLKS
ncbi:MAG: MoxR family ATPase [Phycisphaerales bacterium]|nr:MoxR family ATPase [Phycisphaerales bacterium]